jgi:hypothetical protein
VLRPYDADKMKAGRVDEAVGIVKNDTPDLLTPDRAVDLPYRLLPDEELLGIRRNGPARRVRPTLASQESC